MKLTNNTDETQKLVVFSPSILTTGPWGPAAEVIDLSTHKSVLTVANRAFLSSQIYTQDQLKDKYIYLCKGKSISYKYRLLDIAVINWTHVSLPKGTYELQVFYSGNSSNKIRFCII
jgi:hypothetical protein